MAVRIRVYPQNGLGMMNGLNRMGGAVSASTYFNSKLQSQKQVANLELGYVKALANEKIERARLEERLKNPYLQMQMNPMAMYGMGGMGMMNPYAASMLGSSMLSGTQMFGGLGLGRFF